MQSTYLLFLFFFIFIGIVSNRELHLHYRLSLCSKHWGLFCLFIAHLVIYLCLIYERTTFSKLCCTNWWNDREICVLIVIILEYNSFNWLNLCFVFLDWSWLFILCVCILHFMLKQSMSDNVIVRMIVLYSSICVCIINES